MFAESRFRTAIKTRRTLINDAESQQCIVFIREIGWHTAAVQS